MSEEKEREVWAVYDVDGLFCIELERGDAVMKAADMSDNPIQDLGRVPEGWRVERCLLATEDTLRAERRKGFEAGRLHHPLAGMKYDTFDDYESSLEQKQGGGK